MAMTSLQIPAANGFPLFRQNACASLIYWLRTFEEAIRQFILATQLHSFLMTAPTKRKPTRQLFPVHAACSAHVTQLPQCKLTIPAKLRCAGPFKWDFAAKCTLTTAATYISSISWHEFKRAVLEVACPFDLTLNSRLYSLHNAQ